MLSSVESLIKDSFTGSSSFSEAMLEILSLTRRLEVNELDLLENSIDKKVLVTLV
jgi:hypothetical protein